MPEEYIADDPKHYLEWTVKLKVHKTWVRDGFSLEPYEGDDELTGDDFVEKIKWLTKFTFEHEFLVEVVKKPTKEEMTEAQGWDADGEY